VFRHHHARPACRAGFASRGTPVARARAPHTRIRSATQEALGRAKRDVAFGVRHRGAVGDVSHRARPATSDRDRRCAPLGRHQQVSGTDAGVHERRAGERQDGVGSRVRVGLVSTVGEERRPAPTEAARHEADALDADVPAARQAGFGDETDPSAWRHREDTAAHLVRDDQPAAKPSEGARRDGDPALHRRRAADDRRDAPAAVDREHGRAARALARDEKAVAKTADVVERDPARERTRGEVGEASRLSARVDVVDPGPRHVERVDVVPMERAAGAAHPGLASQREVRFRARVPRVAARPGGERLERGRRIEEEEPARRAHREPPVAAGPAQVDDAGEGHERYPARGFCPVCARPEERERQCRRGRPAAAHRSEGHRPGV